jgi:hypothetical protein
MILGNNLEGYTMHSGTPFEIEEVFGPEAFDTETAGLTPEEKAEMEAEHRQRKGQQGARPSSDEDPGAGS